MDTTIGLALSGGGARAAAHIGVLQALNENKIYPTHVSGTSGGAVIAALYCSGYSPSEILELTQTHAFLQVFKLGLEFRSIRDMSRLKKFLNNHIKEDFKDLELPLYLSVTNLNSGLNEILSKGEVITAIAASCAIPLLFKPVEFNKSSYVDGGILNNLPVEPLLAHCNFTLGSNVSGFEFEKNMRSRLQIAHRCLQLAVNNNVEPRLKLCNHAIEIEKAYHFGTFELEKSQELFNIGYSTTLKEIEAIKKKMEAKFILN
tara:strand:- start:36418 stop:37197 length:780 start_codon:yes stop_codon:yes gene_type:complete